VTIICPVAGPAPFLEETVNSVLAQSYGDWQLVLIDNRAGCDLQAFATLDSRIRVITETRPGAAAARNAALRQVTTAAFAFLDADDLWHPDKLALQSALLRRLPSHGAVYNAFDLIDATGRRVGPGWAPDSLTFRRLCRADGVIPGSNLMVRSSLLPQLGAMNEARRVADDIDYLFRIARLTPIAFLDSVLTFYRLHPHNMTKDYWPSYLDMIALAREYAHDRNGRTRAQARADRRVAVRRLRRTYSGQAFDTWRASPRRISRTAIPHLARSLRLDWRRAAGEAAGKARATTSALSGPGGVGER
jgi:glycosyltransferase involved in cell wall biosynthesis